MCEEITIHGQFFLTICVKNINPQVLDNTIYGAFI